MDNRFTFKDFVLTVLLVGVIAAVLLAMWQSSYQEKRLNDLRQEVQTLNSFQKLQLGILEEIRDTLRRGVPTVGTVTTTTTATTPQTPLASDSVRRKNADGSIYVSYPSPPRPPRDPRSNPNYATGDWFVSNLSSEPAVITPYIDKDAYGSEVQQPVLESLVIRNPDTFEFEPFLAETYEISADGLTFKFVLRKEVRFSDNHPITADDVVFSYKTVTAPGIDSDRAKAYFAQVESCEKVDDRTVVFKFKNPYFKALETCGGLEIIPQHVYKWSDPKDYNSRNALLIGSGPYAFADWKPGQQITLLRNDSYWGPRPTYNKIVFRVITNPQAAFQAFQDEQIDEFVPLPEQYIANVDNPAFKAKFKAFLFKIPNAGYRYIGYNLNRPMFKDKETRQALSMLLNRQAIIDNLQKGQAIPITGPFSPMTPQNDGTVEPLSYDLPVARKKLAAAGWKLTSNNILERDGLPFKFDLAIPSQNPQYQNIAEYVKEQFKKAGISVTISPYEFSVLVDRLDNRNFDAAMLGWTGSIEGDPYQIWHSDSIKDKGSNFVSYKNDEVDRLIVQGRRTLDDAKRMEIWHKVHRLIADDQPYTFLSMAMARQFVHGRFENTEQYKTGMNSLDWFVPLAKQKYR